MQDEDKYIKKLPYAFTEQGVAMLSSVIRSQTAIEVNIQIMRAFVSMRHFMVNNASVFSRLETIIMVNIVATFILLLMSFYLGNTEVKL